MPILDHEQLSAEQLSTEQLSAEQLSAYKRDGYLVIEDFVSKAKCQEMIDQAIEIVAGFDAQAHRSVFTANDSSQSRDEYFLSSGDKIRFFFEAEAFDTAGNLLQSLETSINKLGHAMHDIDPVMNEFSRQPELASIVSELGMSNPLLLQSMYIFKNPYIGGEVNCHQDATFLYTNPITCMGLWFALQDATLENGCLWAIPGGHKEALTKRSRRNLNWGEQGSDQAGARMEIFAPDIEPHGAVALEVRAGTLVVLHGLLPHLSGPNRSAKSRHAYALHLVDGAAEYPADNWLQRGPEMQLRGF